MKDLYIIDVSGFIFRAYFALPPMTSPKGESTGALFGFIRSILKLFKDFDCQHVIAIFDGPNNKNSRLEIYEHYKANRLRSHDDLPHQIDKAKEFLELYGIPQLELSGVEADDVMGTLAKWGQNKFNKIYLCTADKDLCQLVGDNIFLLNPWKENLIINSDKVKEIYGVGPERIIDLLAMMGDSSDNIPGMPGIGPKTAQKLLEEFGSLNYLLDHPEVLTGKKREIFEQYKDQALLSQKLATIHIDLEIPKSESLFVKESKNIIELRKFYQELGFNTLLKELEKQEPQSECPPLTYEIIQDERSLISLIDQMVTKDQITFHTLAENRNELTDPLLSTLFGISLCHDTTHAYYIPITLENRTLFLNHLKALFENPDLLFIGHNIKETLHHLETINIKLQNPHFDTILASYLLQSDSGKHTLEHLAISLFGQSFTTLKELQKTHKQPHPSDLSIDTIANHACQVTQLIQRLYLRFKEGLKKEELEKLFELEMALMPVLAKMESSGVYIDAPYLAKMGDEICGKISELEKTIYAHAGEEFNINSPKQLAHILFEKLNFVPSKKGQSHFSTSAEVLESLARDHVIAHEILAYRTLEKLRSTYVEALPMSIDLKTNRIHPTFVQFGTATGRLACQNPNLQNIPVRGELGKKIREAFCPQKANWVYIAFDYSQIELRLLAHLSEDPDLMNAFIRGEDVHRYTASLMFEVPLQEVSPLQRHQAKAINFGIIYGQGAFGLSQELGIDHGRAATFIDHYFKRYSKIQNYIQASIESVRQRGYALTMFGRKRQIPEINNRNQQIRKGAERLAINTPLQGSAADLIKIAMIEIDQMVTTKAMQTLMVLQVHDELIFEVPEDESSTIINLVKTSMESVYPLKVPLVVDVKVGKNWAEC